MLVTALTIYSLSHEYLIVQNFVIATLFQLAAISFVQRLLQERSGGVLIPEEYIQFCSKTYLHVVSY